MCAYLMSICVFHTWTILCTQKGSLIVIREVLGRKISIIRRSSRYVYVLICLNCMVLFSSHIIHFYDSTERNLFQSSFLVELIRRYAGLQESIIL